MKRFLASVFAVLFALAMAINAGAQTTSTTAYAHNPEIQLAWFYQPPSESLYQTLIQNFDFIILGHKAEVARDQLRSLGETAPIFQYLLLTEIRDPGNCSAVPVGNQVAWKPGDFCMIDSQHPDWFLLDAQGKRIGGGGVHFMDPGNPDFRAFWLERARELQENYGWEAVFIDNAFATLGHFKNIGMLPQKYKTDQEYRDAVIGFLNFLRVNYFLPAGRPMFANVAATQDYGGIWREFLAPLEGMMVENFAAGWLGTTKSRTEWEVQMDALEEAYRRGKTTVLVSQGEQNDLNRQMFSFASYLLIANEHAFFRYAKSGAYSQMWLYDNYDVNLGAPLSARYRQGDTWRRDFLNGYVIVNPGTLGSEIVLHPTPAPTSPTTFPGPFVSMEVNPTSLNLGGTALVSVRLNNMPVDGYKSAEFTCTYTAGLVETSNIVVTDLFGADPAVAIHDPQNGTFIVAMAGTNSNRAATDGPALTFSVRGVQAGQSQIQCVGRVSKGDNVPIDLPSTGTSLTILGADPSPTPIGFPTPLPSPNGSLTGQVIVGKTVTVNLLDADNMAITSVVANPDGTFSLTVPAGNYTVIATASGFLTHQGSANITAGNITVLPAGTLLAGDIDGNNVIDQFDALTIGMNYSAASPSAADLNNDDTIDFLDLELLAENYRKTGPTVWQ